MSGQGEAANKETKELQPIKHDVVRGQQGDKTGFSPAAPHCPPEGTSEEERRSVAEQQHAFENEVTGRCSLEEANLTFKDNELLPRLKLILFLD